MTSFNQLYAQYYDLLYKDKDYQQESNYIHYLIQKYYGNAQSILELGCGTGKHAQLLATKGYDILGVDSSEHMINIAKKSQSGNKCSIRFLTGDIRELYLNEKFDVVLSLFHVMSYQITNSDIEKAFATATRHLKPNGMFIFDFWYGPAVLTEKPETRVKRIQNNELKVTRIAESILDVNRNIVDVNYEIFLKKAEEVHTMKELHKMRYFFMPEVEKLLIEQQLLLEHAFIFLTEQKPTVNSWNVCVVARKEGEE